MNTQYIPGLPDELLLAKIDLLSDYKAFLESRREKEEYRNDISLNCELEDVTNFIEDLEEIRKSIKVGTVVKAITSFQDDVIAESLKSTRKTYDHINESKNFNRLMNNAAEVFEEDLIKYNIFLDTDYIANGIELNRLLTSGQIDQRTSNKHYVAYITLIRNPKFEETHKITDKSLGKRPWI